MTPCMHWGTREMKHMPLQRTKSKHQSSQLILNTISFYVSQTPHAVARTYSDNGISIRGPKLRQDWNMKVTETPVHQTWLQKLRSGLTHMALFGRTTARSGPRQLSGLIVWDIQAKDYLRNAGPRSSFRIFMKAYAAEYAIRALLTNGRNLDDFELHEVSLTVTRKSKLRPMAPIHREK